MVGPGVYSFISFSFIFALYQGWLPFSYDASSLVKILIVVVNLLIFAYAIGQSRLNLWHRVTGLKGAWMPVYVSRLGFSDTAVLISLILFKYLWNAIGFLPKYKPAADGQNIELPELTLSSSIKIDESDYARYDEATKLQSSSSGSRTGEPAPGDRLLLLPALTTPMMLVLVANRYLPVLPFGSVNTANRFEFVDPEACRDPVGTLDLGTKAVVTARVGGADASSLGRRVKRGVEFDVKVQVRCPRNGESEARHIFTQVITILAFLPKGAKPSWNEKAGVHSEAEAAINWAKEPNGAVNFGLSEPAKWAAVCSDYNPIHMSSWMAKMFGFSSKIAHGNHVVATIVEELQNGHGAGAGVAERGLKNLLASKQPSYLEIQFKRPMTLPTELVVRYGSSKDLGTYTFSVEKGDKEHVTGRAGLLRE